MLEGEGTLRTEAGEDLSEVYLRGAKEVERLALEIGAQRAILCERSPACGPNMVWQQGELIQGQGVCAALLRKAGLQVEAPREEQEEQNV